MVSEKKQKRKRDSRKNEYEEKKIKHSDYVYQDDTKSAQPGPDYIRMCTLLDLKMEGVHKEDYRWSWASF